MGTVVAPEVMELEGKKSGPVATDRASQQPHKELNAGALIVLKSKGTWLHCGYHLTTSIVAPAILSLPYAFASLGWAAGVVFLVVGAGVTFYNYNLISRVLEHNAQQGRRQLRFRDMANDILGPGWGRYYIGPIQVLVCFAAVIGSTLLGGKSLQSIYLLSKPEGTMKLYEFIIIFGCLLLVLAQIPSFHSLRHLNLLSLFLCLAYSACATGGSIHAGNSQILQPKDYSLVGSKADKLFGVFSSIAIIATTYGNGVIPEIQATVAPPVKGKMFKALLLCYAVVLSTFFSVAISGYWAFGNTSQSVILLNFFNPLDGSTFVPKWFIKMTNVFILVQLAAVGLVYLQPTNEVLEGLFGDPKSGEYSLRNVVPRLVVRSFAIALGTMFAAMLPFFGDLNALIGAFGFLPLDFVVPLVLYNVTFKPSKRGITFWFNTIIAIIFSVLSVLGCIAAVRKISLDAKNYKLFSDGSFS